MNKICRKCKAEKNISEFFKQARSKDGLAPWCNICNAERKKAYYSANSETIKAKTRAYFEANRERMTRASKTRYLAKRKYIQTTHKKWRELNREKWLDGKKQYYLQNKEKIRGLQKQWREVNRNRILFLNSLRRAREREACPIWANLEAIAEFYINRPEATHVDHIIPLFGKKVTGLHVLANLQYLTPQENLKKGNFFDSGALDYSRRCGVGVSPDLANAIDRQP